jgi:hypothetical protein
MLCIKTIKHSYYIIYKKTAKDLLKKIIKQNNYSIYFYIVNYTYKFLW